MDWMDFELTNKLIIHFPSKIESSVTNSNNATFTFYTIISTYTGIFTSSPNPPVGAS